MTPQLHGAAGAGPRGKEAVDEDAPIPSMRHVTLWEHQALTCSQGRSEQEHKLQDKEETEAKITSSKRDKPGLGEYLLPRWGTLTSRLVARKLKENHKPASMTAGWR